MKRVAGTDNNNKVPLAHTELSVAHFRQDILVIVELRPIRRRGLGQIKMNGMFEPGERT